MAANPKSAGRQSRDRDLASELEAVCAERDALHTKIRDLQVKLDALRRAKAADTRIVKGSTVHVNIPRLSKADLSEADKADADAPPTSCSCSEEIDALRRANQDLEAKTGELLSEISVAETRNTELDTLAADLKAELAVERETLESIRTELEQSRAEVEAISASLLVSQTDQERLATDLEATRREIRRLRDMVAAGGTLAAVAHESQAEIIAALSEKELENKQMQAQLHDLRRQLSQVRIQSYEEASGAGNDGTTTDAIGPETATH